MTHHNIVGRCVLVVLRWNCYWPMANAFTWSHLKTCRCPLCAWHAGRTIFRIILFIMYARRVSKYIVRHWGWRWWRLCGRPSEYLPNASTHNCSRSMIERQSISGRILSVMRHKSSDKHQWFFVCILMDALLSHIIRTFVRILCPTRTQYYWWVNWNVVEHPIRCTTQTIQFIAMPIIINEMFLIIYYWCSGNLGTTQLGKMYSSIGVCAWFRDHPSFV